MPQKLYTQEQFNEKLNEFWNNLKKYGDDVLAIRNLVSKPKPVPTLPTHLIHKIMMYQPRPQYIKDIKFLGSEEITLKHNDAKIQSMFGKVVGRIVVKKIVRKYLNWRSVKNLAKKENFTIKRQFNGWRDFTKKEKIDLENITPFSFELDHFGDYTEYLEKFSDPRISYEYSCCEYPFWFIGRDIKERKKWNDEKYMSKEDLEFMSKNCCLKLKKSWSRKRILQELMKL